MDMVCVCGGGVRVTTGATRGGGKLDYIMSIRRQR